MAGAPQRQPGVEWGVCVWRPARRSQARRAHFSVSALLPPPLAGIAADVPRLHSASA